MKSLSTLSLIIILVCWATPTYAQGAAVTPALAQQAAAAGMYREMIDSGIESLLTQVDLTVADEEPRLLKKKGGALRFFGAPPGAHAQLPRDLENASLEDKAYGFLAQHGAAFGIYNPNVAFETFRVRQTENRSYVRLQQTYDGLPVFAGQMIVQLDDANGVAAVFSDIMAPSLALDRLAHDATISDVEAEDIALDAAGDSLVSSLEDSQGNLLVSQEELALILESLRVPEEAELLIYDPAVGGASGDTALAWRLSVESTAALFAEAIFVDAHSGEVVFRYPLVCSALARAIYDGVDFDPFDPQPFPLVRDDPPSEGNGELPTSDPDNPHTNGTPVNDADDTFDLLDDPYDFYWVEHGRDSYDDNGATLKAVVNFFTGGAWWIIAYEEIRISAGYAVDDVIAHEMTHGVTQMESELGYSNESGHLNESLSDIWGEFVDQDNDEGAGESRWELAEDSIDGTIRDMSDPTAYDQPDRYEHPDYDSGSDPHDGSGVGNKLCYLLTDGDTFQGRTISGMGISRVADLFYECQTNLLTSEADYTDLYLALTQAASPDNLNWSQSERDNLEQACRAVEIRATNYMTIEDNSGNPLVRFTDAGDLLIHDGGTFYENQTISPSSSVPEFIVKWTSYNRALVNGDNGNMYILNDLYEEVSSPDPPDNSSSFIIKDGAGTVKAFINGFLYPDSSLNPTPPYYVGAGSLILAGEVVYLDY